MERLAETICTNAKQKNSAKEFVRLIVASLRKAALPDNDLEFAVLCGVISDLFHYRNQINNQTIRLRDFARRFLGLFILHLKKVSDEAWYNEDFITVINSNYKIKEALLSSSQRNMFKITEENCLAEDLNLIEYCNLINESSDSIQLTFLRNLEQTVFKELGYIVKENIQEFVLKFNILLSELDDKRKVPVITDLINYLKAYKNLDSKIEELYESLVELREWCRKNSRSKSFFNIYSLFASENSDDQQDEEPNHHTCDSVMKSQD